MSKCAIILAVTTALVLTGCAASTREAYTKGVDRGLSYIDGSRMTVDEYAEAAVVVADACDKAAKADPASFNQEWN